MTDGCTGPSPSCPSSDGDDSPRAVQAAIDARFRRLARAPQDERRFAVGRASAESLGYDPIELGGIPEPVIARFAGVGDPLEVARLRPRERVLDLGCGAGLDSWRAAHRVGSTGYVVGVERLRDMLVVGREASRSPSRDLANGARPPCFVQADAARLPLRSARFDVAVSNGVLNLCLDKRTVLAELHRALRPGGRLVLSDIVLEPHVAPEDLEGMGAWSD